MAQSGNPPGALSVVLPTLAAMLFVAALLAFSAAVALVFPGPAWIAFWNLNPAAWESLHHLGWNAVVLLLVLGCIAGPASIGLMLHRRWAWWIAILLFLINAAGDLISLIRTNDTLRFSSGIAIAAGFVILLCLPRVRSSLR
jgi:hypothetical protein